MVAFRPFLPAFFLLLLPFLAAGDVESPDPDVCAPLYDRAAEVLSTIVAVRPAVSDSLWIAFRDRSAEGAACYAPVRHERAVTLTHWEVVALEELEWLTEMHNTVERFMADGLADIDSVQTAFIFRRRAYINSSYSRVREAINDYMTAIRYGVGMEPRQRSILLRQPSVLLLRMSECALTDTLFREAERTMRAVESPNDLERIELARAIVRRLDAYRSCAEDEAWVAPPIEEIHLLYAEVDELLDSVENQPATFSERAEFEIARAWFLRSLDRPDEALSALDRVEKFATSDRHRFHANRVRGRLLLDKGRTEEGLARFLEGDSLIRRAMPDDLDFQRRSAYWIGEAYEFMEDWAAAEEWHRRAIALAEVERERIEGTDWVASWFSHPIIVGAYRGLVRVLLALDRPEEAFSVLEGSRARHLSDLRGQGQVISRLPAASRMKVDSLRTMRTKAQARAEGPGTDEADRIQARVEYNLLSAQIATIIGRPQEQSAPSVADVQRVLGDRVLVSYFIGSNYVYPDAPTTAFVVTADGMHTVDVDLPWTDARALADRLYIRPETGVVDLPTLASLYDRLFRPLEQHIPEGKRVILIPDGALMSRIPFAALVQDAPSNYSFASVRYLIHRHPLALEASSTLLLEPAAPARHDVDLLFVGRSEFAGAATPPFGVTGTEFVAQDLPGVIEEHAGVTRAVRNSKSYLNRRATVETFLRRAPSARIVHMSTHAVSRGRSPYDHAVLFAPDQKHPDGWISAASLQTLSLSSELIVLSGCHTGTGLGQGGEGLRGLLYSIRAAGSRAVIGSMWQLDDGTAATLFPVFYRNLADGQPKDVALRNAQLEYLSQAVGPLAAPRFWASLVILGDTSPVTFEQTSRLPYLVALGFLLTGILIAARRRRNDRVTA
jgi:CHAT domain-containing protein/tetratricopeptide (TPR) repeat protein